MTKDQKPTASSPGASFFRASTTPPAKVRPAGHAPPQPKSEVEPDFEKGSGDVYEGALRVSAFNCKALADAEPHALGLTYEFDAATEGEPYAVVIAFKGHRNDVKRKLGASDRFETSTTVTPVVPGSGRVSVTTRVPGLAAGSWSVVARPTAHQIGGDRSRPGARRADLPQLPAGVADGSTGWAPVIAQKAPGVILGSWAALVALGAVVALSLQAVLATRLGLSLTSVLLVSVIASLIGLVGAKVYYLVVYPAERRQALIGGGMCIQGFVLGAAVGLVSGALLTGVPLGTLLDITAPPLMVGMMIGRFGCFFSGCCVGRPTASRWGLWSSDRRLGVRRIPTQLLESAVAAIVGALSLVVLVAEGSPPPGGLVFVGALAAYVGGRQLLLPLRAESRKTRYGRTITLVASAIALAAAVIAGTITYAL